MRAAGASHDMLRLGRHFLTRLSNDVLAATPRELTTAELVEWLGAHRWSRETSRAARSSVRTFYAWAVDAGVVEHNPSVKLPPVRSSSGTRRPASEDAYQRALATAQPREYLILRMAAELGMRRAEIAQAHARDLTESADGWWLLVHGKGDKSRVVPVPDDLAAIMTERPGWLFPGLSGGHLSVEHVGVLTSRLLPPGVSAHHLRHKFATDAYAATTDLLAVQLLLGHSTPTVTQRYVQVPDHVLRATVMSARALR